MVDDLYAMPCVVSGEFELYAPLKWKPVELLKYNNRTRRNNENYRLANA